MSATIMKSRVLVEAICVGLGLVLLTFIMSLILPEKINMWVAVFITGVVFHLVCEVTGINLWYKKN